MQAHLSSTATAEASPSSWSTVATNLQVLDEIPQDEKDEVTARANRSTAARSGTSTLPPRGKPPVAVPSTRHSTPTTSHVAAAHSYSTPDAEAGARRQNSSEDPSTEHTPSHLLHESESEPKASSPPPRARQYLQSAFPQRSRTVHTAAGVGLSLERPEGSSLLIGAAPFYLSRLLLVVAFLLCCICNQSLFAGGGLPVKSITKGGKADVDGRICVNDSLLKIDGQSLSGLDIFEVLPACVCLWGRESWRRRFRGDRISVAV